jgi:hypothetical protein
MTAEQKRFAEELERELTRRGKRLDTNWGASNSPETQGFFFSSVRGVTVTLAPNGLLNVPSVRSYHPPDYPTPAVASACADERWAKQKKRDDRNLELAKSRSTGHLGPRIPPSGCSGFCRNSLSICINLWGARQSPTQGCVRAIANDQDIDCHYWMPLASWPRRFATAHMG